MFWKIHVGFGATMVQKLVSYECTAFLSGTLRGKHKLLGEIDVTDKLLPRLQELLGELPVTSRRLR